MSKLFINLSRKLLLTLLLGSFALSYSALSSAQQDETKLPIEVTADRLVSQDQKGISVYTGNVVITQGTTQIKGDKVTLHHPNRKISQAIILGKPATFKRFIPEEKNWVNGHAKTITYDTQKKTVLLEGDAFVNQENKNSISGPRILYNTLEKTLNAQGDKAQKKRIKVIFESEEDKDDAEDNS